MSKHKWLDRVVVAHDLDVDAKAAAIELFPYILENGGISASTVDASGLEAAGYILDGCIHSPPPE
jgi:hypothetical protein